MSVTTLADVRALVETILTDSQLQDVIDRVEEDLTQSLGDFAATLDGDDLTEVHAGGVQNIFLNRPVESVTTVTEYSTLTATTGTALTENTDFVVWAKEGRLQRIGRWGAKVTIAYQPVNQDKKWIQAVADLVRYVINHQSQKAESVAGEYSYTAPDYAVEKRKIVRRLQFVVI